MGLFLCTRRSIALQHQQIRFKHILNVRIRFKRAKLFTLWPLGKVTKQDAFIKVAVLKKSVLSLFYKTANSTYFSLGVSKKERHCHHLGH